MLAASNLPPKDIELVRREIQEIRDALQAFKAAVEAGEVPEWRREDPLGGLFVAPRVE